MLGKLSNPSNELLAAGFAQIVVGGFGVAAVAVVAIVLDFELGASLVASAVMWLLASAAATFAYFAERGERESQPTDLPDVSNHE